MPHQELAFCRQNAVLWDFNSYDGYGQAKVAATPVAIKVRWNDKQNQSMGKDGNSISVDATAVVLQNIAIGSVLWLGLLTDANAYQTAGAFPRATLMEVKAFNATPDLKNRVAFRTVGMIRLKDVLPTTV